MDSKVGGWASRGRWWKSGSAGSTVDDVGDERGLESTMTVLGVCCRIGSTGFGDCVEFDSVL